MRRWVFPSVALLALAASPAGRDGAWVEKEAGRVRASDNESWRRIPWASSLTGAAAAARREGRPMFVFSHEGNIDTGRC